MKRQLPLKWGLTVSMAGVWALVVIISALTIRVLVSRINDRLEKTMKSYQLADAAAIASSIEFEVAAQDHALLNEKIANRPKNDVEILSISVLDTQKKLFYTNGRKETVESTLKSIGKITAPSTHIVDTRMVTVVPVKLEGNDIAGYVVEIISLKDYHSDKTNLTWGLIIAAFLGLLVVQVAAYLIGRNAAVPMHQLMDAAQRIADGDLSRVDFSVKGSQEATRLAASVRAMAQAMQTQVLAIKKLTSEISQVARETEGTMASLASSATQQAAAVNETAATVEELEKAGQSSAGNAKQIVVAAEKTAEASTRGRQTVEKTYNIMMQIKDDSQDISVKSRNLLNSVEEVGNIIQSVNSIAEQSKILAVNASIEAAKAGEFGSGFAVVAQEVKDLAQQSKDATVQITGTLTAIREAIETMVVTAQSGKDRTEEGVDTIANAGAVMNDLSDAIRENSDFANVIATNIKQQTVGLTQIAAAIEEINTTSLENQNISRNIVEGTSQMSTSIGLLNDMVGRWQTSENSVPVGLPLPKDDTE